MTTKIRAEKRVFQLEFSKKAMQRVRDIWSVCQGLSVEANYKVRKVVLLVLSTVVGKL